MTKKEVEGAISNHAEWIEHLAGRMDELAVQMKELAAAQTRTEAAQTRTDAQIAETNKALREMGEVTDKRIRDLVSAIGEFISAKGTKNGKA